MPYIKQERRQAIVDTQLNGGTPRLETSGELNFVITEVVCEYLAHHTLSYSTINDILGALEGAKHEFYRRVTALYEDQKIKENGDVYK